MTKIMIMLSGRPCVGKTTFQNKLVLELQKENLISQIISMDEILEQLQIEFQKIGQQLSRNEIFDNHQQVVQERYLEKLHLAQENDASIVILDRVNLALAKRQEVLNIFTGAVFLIHFTVTDEAVWRHSLWERNKKECKQNHFITPETVEKLLGNYFKPSKEEGFKFIYRCRSFGDDGWEEQQNIVIESLLKRIANEMNRLGAPELVL